MSIPHPCSTRLPYLVHMPLLVVFEPHTTQRTALDGDAPSVSLFFFLLRVGVCCLHRKALVSHLRWCTGSVFNRHRQASFQFPLTAIRTHAHTLPPKRHLWLIMSLSVRIRTPKTSTPVQVELNSSGTWGEAATLLSQKSGIALERLRVLAGFPPKAVELSASSPLSALMLRVNDMLIVQEGEARVLLGNTGQRYVPPAPEKAHFTRRRCPADNSCLFHACAYVLHDKSRTEGPQIRQECVKAVLDHPEMFNRNTLGMDPVAYAMWLSGKDSWGGAIELEILSFLYQTEIFALDLQSVSLQHFGTGMGYTVRAFLVYTGNHYDCIAMNPVYNSPSEHEDQTLFNSRDENVLARAKRFVAEEGQKVKEGRSA
nr:unnamed protein product [Leishmania braziliensis]